MLLKSVLLCLALLIITPLVYTQSKSLVLKTNNHCTPSDEMQQSLAAEFNEIPFVIAQGNVESSVGPNIYTGLMITYVNPKTASFTMVIHFEEKNVSCVVMTGEGFQPAPTAEPIKALESNDKYNI